jgi:hypothetical protein
MGRPLEKIMPQRENPFGVKVSGPIKLAADPNTERQVVTQAVQEVLTADMDRQGWLDRQQRLSKLRYGLRPKVKDFPFKGASNLSIPLIDSTIRKYKPMIMRLLVEPDPIVEFQGDNPDAIDAERDAEELYNWLFKTHMDAIEPMAYVIDYEVHRGFAFAQVYWDYRTEYECRTVDTAQLFPEGILPGQQPQEDGSVAGAPDPQQIAAILVEQYELNVEDPKTTRALNTAVNQIANGQRLVKIAFRKVICDKPAIADRDPVQIIMPTRCTDVRDAEWVCVQHVLSVRKIEQMEADGYFEKGSVAKIKTDMAKADQTKLGKYGEGAGAQTPSLQSLQDLEDRRTQIWGRENDGNILLWELFHWRDIDNDGLADRVHTWIHPKSYTKLVSRAYSMPFHRWPLVKFDFEKTSRRWHAPRGISAMLEGIQRETNAQHNARIDAMTLRNAPVYQIQAAAGFKARNFRVVPGTVLQLPVGSQLSPILQDRSAFPEQVNEEQQLRSLAESYVGTMDFALANPQAASRARTATEIQAAAQFASSVATLDTMLFQLAMRDLHEMVWKLWMDLGPPEVALRVLGPNGLPVAKIVKKAYIDQSYALIPTGTIANTNRALELAHAREALQLYIDDQSGYINPYELRKWHINLLAYRQARRIMNSQEQAKELQVLRQAAAEIQNNPELQASMAGQVYDVPEEEIARQKVAQNPRRPANEF